MRMKAGARRENVRRNRHGLVAASLLLCAAAAGAAAATSSIAETSSTPAAVEPWGPASSPRASASDLRHEYNAIFRRGNRNAASHRWSTFLLDRSDQMTPERLELFFGGFCAVSGSPVRPGDYNRYRLTLPRIGGGAVTGYMHYCCWPCVCDTQDFIRVDTLNVTDVTGTVRRRHFAVIGNPCDDPDALEEPFVQPFGRGTTTLAETAREVHCLEGGVLEGATMSDHGYVIIGMFFDAAAPDANDKGVAIPGASESLPDPTPGRISNAPSLRGGGSVMFQDEREWGPRCTERAANGYNSGMGEIFRQVCAVSPIRPEVLEAPPFTAELVNENDCDDGKQCRWMWARIIGN